MVTLSLSVGAMNTCNAFIYRIYFREQTASFDLLGIQIAAGCSHFPIKNLALKYLSLLLEIEDQKEMAT